MNIGKMILQLRKQKKITQDEFAAELGVTAAAVSKWENGYTLPDIMMLCALADFFGVTTDELLGRNIACKNAIIVSQTKELGQKIARLIAHYNIQASQILTTYEDALAIMEGDSAPKVHYVFTAIDRPLKECEMGRTQNTTNVNVHVTGGTDEDVLNGIELYLKNIDAFQNLSDITATGKR